MTMMSDNAGAPSAPPVTQPVQMQQVTSLHEALGLQGDAPAPRPVPIPVADEIVHLDCPGCGVLYSGPRPSRSSARSFCPSCDYPLFLAVAAPPPASGETDLGKRRLPGVDGKDQLGAVPCPNCAEPNLPDPDGHCIRCGESLFPVALPAPEPEPLPEVDAIVVFRSNYWWIIATVTLSAVLAATASALYWVW